MKNRDLSILMITLFGQIQKEEMEALKAKKPKRYEGLLAERKKVAEAEEYSDKRKIKWKRCRFSGPFLPYNK